MTLRRKILTVSERIADGIGQFMFSAFCPEAEFGVWNCRILCLPAILQNDRFLGQY